MSKVFLKIRCVGNFGQLNLENKKSAHKRLIFFKWCPWQESNLRPSGPQPDALSTELQGRINIQHTKVSIQDTGKK